MHETLELEVLRTLVDNYSYLANTTEVDLYRTIVHSMDEALNYMLAGKTPKEKVYYTIMKNRLTKNDHKATINAKDASKKLGEQLGKPISIATYYRYAEGAKTLYINYLKIALSANRIGEAKIWAVLRLLSVQNKKVYVDVYVRREKGSMQRTDKTPTGRVI